MVKPLITCACGAALLLAGSAVHAIAQESQGGGQHEVVVQDDQGKDKVVIKDDTTPKVKKGVKIVADAEITTAVKTKLMGDKVARASDIDVDTKNGIVTLSGTVPTTADKTRIGGIARRTKGVTRVENRLMVSAASRG